jgi:putative transposase
MLRGRILRAAAFTRMPRRPREEIEDGIFHVFARGNRRQPIYLDDADRRRYLAMLSSVVTQCHWRCLAYCLMENHLHLLLETPKANLGQGMQSLQSRYAQSFNGRHRRSGHLFQGRYGAARVKSDGQMWVAVRYLALNPVEAGLCALPGEWAWSSYGATLAGTAPAWLDAARLLSHFDAAGGDRRERLADFVEGDFRGEDGARRDQPLA